MRMFYHHLAMIVLRTNLWTLFCVSGKERSTGRQLLHVCCASSSKASQISSPSITRQHSFILPIPSFSHSFLLSHTLSFLRIAPSTLATRWTWTLHTLAAWVVTDTSLHSLSLTPRSTHAHTTLLPHRTTSSSLEMFARSSTQTLPVSTHSCGAYGQCFI